MQEKIEQILVGFEAWVAENNGNQDPENYIVDGKDIRIDWDEALQAIMAVFEEAIPDKKELDLVSDIATPKRDRYMGWNQAVETMSDQLKQSKEVV